MGAKIAAGHLARLVPNKHSKILDIGCGTGLAGEEVVYQSANNGHGVNEDKGLPLFHSDLVLTIILLERRAPSTSQRRSKPSHQGRFIELLDKF